MEQPSRKAKFIKTHFNKVYVHMELKDEILRELDDDEHNPCKHLMPALKALDDKKAQKCFLICEFTNEREPAEYLAKLLRKHKQGQVADYLEEFNSSEGFIPYVTTEYLPVRHSSVLRSGGSCRFEMETSPRGLCLIIVNEQELEPEAKQLASIFSQMYFTAIVEKRKTCTQIKKIFDYIATDPKNQGFNALVTILIGHGKDGFFCGANNDADPNDNVLIPQLIDKFAEDKCLNFKGKPKVNIFNCCRSRTFDKILSDVQYSLYEQVIIFDKSWVNNNINTTVIYSCAEGQESFYSPTTGFSFFGRALSHTIAQFACEQNLDQLIKTVNKRLENDDKNQFPEVIQYKSRWALYFNPGRIRIN